jgi:hypothetical protein
MEDRVKNLSGKNFHISRAARRHKDVSANERGMRGVNEPPPIPMPNAYRMRGLPTERSSHANHLEQAWKCP